MTDLFVQRRAWWSDEMPTPLYRYMLSIVWNAALPMLVVIMANPSTATEFANDPTVARVEERARRLGFGGVIILNAFAFRATDPGVMFLSSDPVGKFNDSYILRTLKDSKIKGWTVMVGWGEIGRHRRRHLEVAKLLALAGVQPVCLRISKSGQPGHPLYIAYDIPFQPWPLAA